MSAKETLRVWTRKRKDSGKATPAKPADLEDENRRLRAASAEASTPTISSAKRQPSSRQSPTAHQQPSAVPMTITLRVRSRANRAHPVGTAAQTL